jgi:hypothetical protein
VLAGVIGVIIPLIGQMCKKAMGRSTTASQVTAKTVRDFLNIPSAIRDVVGVALVLLGAFAFNFARYPVIREAELQRPHRLGVGAAYGIYNALQIQIANLKVPGS